MRDNSIMPAKRRHFAVMSATQQILPDDDSPVEGKKWKDLSKKEIAEIAGYKSVPRGKDIDSLVKKYIDGQDKAMDIIIGKTLRNIDVGLDSSSRVEKRFYTTKGLELLKIRKSEGEGGGNGVNWAMIVNGDVSISYNQ